jgi:hypothetical protein
MFETARLVETLDVPRDDADIELLVLRLLVAAESDVDPCAPLEFAAGAEPREFAEALEFMPPLRPTFAEADEPRLAADAEEPLLNPRAEFAPEAPKCALEGGATPARLPEL